MRGIVKIYSYLFHLVLALFLLGMSVVALSSGLDLQLDMFPWHAKNIAVWLLALNLAGIVAILLALAGKVRVLFLVWSLAVLVGLVRGFFLSPYNFTGPVSFRTAIVVTLASVLALIGAVLQYRGTRTAPRKITAAAR